VVSISRGAGYSRYENAEYDRYDFARSKGLSVPAEGDSILSWSLGRKLTGPLRLGRRAPRNGEGRQFITPPSNQKRLPLFLTEYFRYRPTIPLDEAEALRVPASNLFAIASPSILNCLRAVLSDAMLFLSRIMRSAVP
jgi:hypothetical protein